MNMNMNGNRVEWRLASPIRFRLECPNNQDASCLFFALPFWLGLAWLAVLDTSTLFFYFYLFFFFFSSTRLINHYWTV